MSDEKKIRKDGLQRKTKRRLVRQTVKMRQKT